MAGPESREPGAGGPSRWVYLGLGFELAVPVVPQKPLGQFAALTGAHRPLAQFAVPTE